MEFNKNKKRCNPKAFLLILLLIILTTSTLAIEQIYIGQIESGESIDIDEFNFIVTLNKNVDRIFVAAGTMYKSVPIYTCKDMEMFELCFDNATFDTTDEIIKIDFRISRKKPTISILRTISDSEIYVGEETIITTTLSNTGDAVNALSMLDDIPKELTIKDVTGHGCRIHENGVIWTGHMTNNSEVSCTYTLEGNSKLEKSLTAKIEYFDGFKYQTEYSSTIDINVLPILTHVSRLIREDYTVGKITESYTAFSFTNDNDALKLGETGRLIINLTNLDPTRKIYIDQFEINIPKSVEYSGTGFLRFDFANASGNRSSEVWDSHQITQINNRLLRWNGWLESNRSKLFILNLKALETTTNIIKITKKYTYKGHNKEESSYEKFIVGDPGILITASIEDFSDIFSRWINLNEEDNKIDVEAVHPYKLRLKIQNMNEFLPVKNIKINPITKVFSLKNTTTPMLDKQSTFTTHNILVIFPNVQKSTEYKLNLSLNYLNKEGITLENSTEFEFTVKPNSDLIISTSSSQSNILESEEETEFKVTVKNQRLVDLKNVYVSDNIPSDFKIKGIHSKKLKLNKEKETQVYKYTLTAPRVNKEKQYNITTTLNFFNENNFTEYNMTYISTIKVIPIIPKISITKTINRDSKTYTGETLNIDYTITNDETKSKVKDLTIFFPLQPEIDTIDKKTHYIKSLDPGESITLTGIEKIRIKEANNKNKLEVNQTMVEYFDEYGNKYNENSTETNFEISKSKISGPAIKINRTFPQKVNATKEFIVLTTLENIGKTKAKVVLFDMNKTFNIDIKPGAKETIKNKITYTEKGEYILPAPELSYSFQKQILYSKGYADTIIVNSLIEPIKQEIKKTESKKEQTSNKSNNIKEDKKTIKSEEVKAPIQWIFLILTIIIIAIILIVFIFFKKGKRSTEQFIDG